MLRIGQGDSMATAVEHNEAIPTNRKRWGVDDWQAHLQAPGRRLVELHALTENSFLQIGDALQGFYQRAGNVSDTAREIAENLLGEDASEHVARLQLLVERMSIFLAEIKGSSQHNETALQAICQALEKLTGPLKAFQKITKTLQVVGITTRVECSSHVESGSQNSTVLSDNLRRLAVLIAGNMEAIIDQVGLLKRLSEEALKNEAALNNGQSSRAVDAVEHARAVLVELGANHERAAGKSEGIAHCSAAISRNIGEIVSSMQFHDITRQQIEHVSQAIESLGREIENAQHADPDMRENIELAVAEGCRLQSEQLNHARSELTAAVWRIIESLQALSGSVTELTQDTCELAGSTEKDGATYFAALEPAIESVTSILVENSETASQSLQTVVNVVCAAEEMSTLVEEIERFGAEMKVLSLNASVEAVHAKKGGSSLSVIADSIQDLANEALLQTETLAGGLKEITHHAETLGGGEIRGSLNKKKEVEQLLQDAEEILGELRQKNSGLTDSLGLVEKTSGSLAVDIAETAAGIRIHEQVNDILTAAISDLADVTERFPVAENVLDKVQHIPLFKEMLGRYSMKSERDIHLRVLRQKEKATIEPDGDDGSAAKNDGTANNLGSNVELF